MAYSAACMGDNKLCDANSNTINITRRSANYLPSSWDYNAIQSLASDYMNPFMQGEGCAKRAEELKEEIRHLFKKKVQPLQQLELVYALQRLGLGYDFEEEIKSSRSTIPNIRRPGNNYWKGMEQDLHETALHFMLLRHDVSQDTMQNLMDEKDTFKKDVCEDLKDMLSLYEALHLGFHQENSLLEEAIPFCVGSLKGYPLKKRNIGQSLEAQAAQLEHAMGSHLQRRIPWLEIRSCIENYEKRGDMEPCLLKMSKLNFNIQQAIHQAELKSLSRWWRRMGLGVKLEFARDRCVEAYFWSLATIPEPQYAYCRKQLAKVFLLITTIDDVYDVYGSVDELELFTNAVDRWDINAIGRLPEYMKICFLALFNTINKVSYDILKEQGLHITSYLSKQWGNLCKSFMKEAKWFDGGYTPSLDEYLDNGWISSSGPLILAHAFCFMGQKITKEDLECFEGAPDPIHLSSIIFRLCNDLGTSRTEVERGDAPGCVECYMRETGLPEESARRHIKGLIEDAWKKMIKECLAPSSFPKLLVKLAMNLARTVQGAYHSGDGYGAPDQESKQHVLSVLFQPIPIRQQ